MPKPINIPGGMQHPSVKITSITKYSTLCSVFQDDAPRKSGAFLQISSPDRPNRLVSNPQGDGLVRGITIEKYVPNDIAPWQLAAPL